MATTEPDPTVPKAFISYSWDDDAHKEWVKQLAIRLRADGVDVTLDRWHSAPGDQITAFMERAVRENDFVIAVCTPQFKERSDRRGGGVGGGVDYEGDIMTAYAFTGGDKRKFIPVLRHGSWREAAPTWLLGTAKIDLSRDPYLESEYEELLSTLLGVREKAPPLGHRPKSGDKKGSQASPAPVPVTPLTGSSTPQNKSSVTSTQQDFKQENECRAPWDTRSTPKSDQAQSRTWHTTCKRIALGAFRFAQLLLLVMFAFIILNEFTDWFDVSNAPKRYRVILKSLNRYSENPSVTPVVHDLMDGQKTNRRQSNLEIALLHLSYNKSFGLVAVPSDADIDSFFDIFLLNHKLEDRAAIRAQVATIRRDIASIRPRWFIISPRKNVPIDASYVERDGDQYVWIHKDKDQEADLDNFTRIIQSIVYLFDHYDGL